MLGAVCANRLFTRQAVHSSCEGSMFCTECGSRLPESSKFCGSCGNVVKGPVVSGAVANPEPARRPTPSATRSAKRCPACGLPSPLSSPRCRCGHEFTGTAAGAPADFSGTRSSMPARRTSRDSSIEGKKLPEAARDSKPDNRWSVSGVAAAVIGALIGRYSGVSLIIPLAAAALAWALASRIVTGNARHFLAAISVQVGHVVWFAIGILAAGAAGLAQVGFDILIMAAGLAWLIIRPGRWPVIFLSFWQALSLLFNVQAFAEATVASAAHRALVVHIALRVSSIYFMVTGLKALRQPTEVETAAA